jgi:hypothetical protein
MSINARKISKHTIYLFINISNESWAIVFMVLQWIT